MDVRPRLASVAGAQPQTLAKSPGDLIRYAALGGVIISTALVAAASATLAVHMTMHMPVFWAIVVGACWGLIIYNLDRLLVVQMVRQDRKLLVLATALPRVGLALVLGTVISTPMVLQIFAPEIRTELEVIRQEEQKEFAEQLATNPDYASIDGLARKVQAEEDLVNRGVTGDISQVPEVVAAREALRIAQTAFETAEQAVVCEKEGTCGSGRSGAGIAYQEKVEIRNEARTARELARNNLTAAETTARATIRSSESTAIDTARERLRTDKPRLEQLRADRAADAARYRGMNSRNSGLLAQLEALHRISGSHPTLLLAHLALFLLFLSIELLPVLMKLLQVLGPKTRYEKLLETDEQDALAARVRESAHAQVLQQSRLDIAEKAEAHRAKHAIKAARANNRLMIETQQRVMDEILVAWQEYALRTAEADLDQWRRDHPLPGGPTPPPARLSPLVGPLPTAPDDDLDDDLDDEPDDYVTTVPIPSLRSPVRIPGPVPGPAPGAGPGPATPGPDPEPEPGPGAGVAAGSGDDTVVGFDKAPYPDTDADTVIPASDDDDRGTWRVPGGAGRGTGWL